MRYLTSSSSLSISFLSFFHMPLKSELTAFSSSQLDFSSAARAADSSNPISIIRATASFCWIGFAYVAVQYRAVRSNSAKLSKYNLATTASWGSFGSGQLNKACKDNKALLIVNAGLHLSLRMSCYDVLKYVSAGKGEGETTNVRSTKIAGFVGWRGVKENVNGNKCVATATTTTKRKNQNKQYETYQTNRTSLTGNIGMEYFGNEFHFGWFEWVLGWDDNINIKYPTIVDRSFRSFNVPF
jgi:hypothetical protein